MVDTVLHLASIPYAIVAATAAGVLSLLAWNRVRSSPLETAVGLLSIAMVLATTYHVIALVSPASPLVDALRIASSTAVVGLVLVVAVVHARIQRRTSARGA